MLVDFTRDYDAIKLAIAKVEHYDSTCLAKMLHAVKGMLLSNWGSQNHSQVLVFTDCGIGMGPDSLRSTIATLSQHRISSHSQLLAVDGPRPQMCLPFTFASRLSFVCLGQPADPTFCSAVCLYRELLNVSGQQGELFVPAAATANESTTAAAAPSLNASSMHDLVTQMCETNYKPFEATLKCGGYAKLECSVNIWPPPTVNIPLVELCILALYSYQLFHFRRMSIPKPTPVATSSAPSKSAVTFRPPKSARPCPLAVI